RVHTGRPLEEAADRNGISRVVRAMVDHLEHVVASQYGGGHVLTARARAIRQRHLASTEGHLIPRDSHRLQQASAQTALGLLVQVDKVVAGLIVPASRVLAPFLFIAHAATSFSSSASVSASASRRILRIRSSSD